MRAAIFLATLFGASVSAIAGTSTIMSPDHHQTFAYGEMLSHQLYLARAGGELAARITFSNMPYNGDDEPRTDESFDFHFPGIRFDATRRTFFVSDRGGQTIPVARFRDGLFCGWVDLAPGAKIYLHKESGRVTRHFDRNRSSARGKSVDRNGQQLVAAESFDCAIRPACPRPAVNRCNGVSQSETLRAGVPGSIDMHRRATLGQPASGCFDLRNGSQDHNHIV